MKALNIDSHELENEDEAMDYFRDYFYVNYPYETFLKQIICCDIFIDSGDYNYDLGCNCIYPHYDGDSSSKMKDISNECVLVWLAKKQGYTKKDFYNYIRKFGK